MGSGTSKQNAVSTFEISDDDEEDKNWATKNHQKKEETKGKSVLGKVFGKPKATTNLTKARTIVDLSSSDSEDDYRRPIADQDAELRDDINSLEKTLSSLGLEKRGRQVRVRDNKTTAYSSDSDGGYLTSSTSVAMGTDGQRKQYRRRKDLKFSWDDRQQVSQQEDWTVQKVRIAVQLQITC